MSENKYNYTPLPEPVPITDQEWPEGTIPLVHTRTMTYNHEDYIRDCIEGILMQKTTFPVQVLIHDDASTDRTAQIVKEFEERYPQLIKAYYQEENTFQIRKNYGSFRGSRDEFSSWRVGKYEAPCEGDDYWTDPLKLQKQAKFLDENEEYSLVVSKQRNIDDQGNIIGEGKGGTRTMMYPTSINIPPKFRHLIPHGDNLRKATLKLHGRRYCFNEVMAVWRKHDGGVWGSLQAKEDEHKLEYNRGLTKLGIGLTFIDKGHSKHGINYLVQSYFHFFKTANVKLSLIDKIYFFLKVIKNFFNKY